MTLKVEKIASQASVSIGEQSEQVVLRGAIAPAAAGLNLAPPAAVVAQAVLAANEKAAPKGEDIERDLNLHAGEIARCDNQIRKAEIEEAASVISKKNYPVGWHCEVVSGKEYLVFQESAVSIPKVYLRAYELGHGGYSTIWKLVSLNTGKNSVLKVAKKIIQKDFSVRSLKNEMGILSLLNREGTQVGIQTKPHYPEPITFTDKSGREQIGFIEDLCEGDLLEERPSSAEELMKCISDIVKGLIYFQGRCDLRHGDLKLENILKDGNDYRIADWGSAITYGKLEREFNEKREEALKFLNVKSEEMRPNFVTRSIVISDLVGQCTQRYCCVRDMEKLNEAFAANKWKDFKAIEKARDVYATAIMISELALDPEDLDKFYGFLRDEHSIPARGRFSLTENMVGLYRKQSFSEVQISMMDRMLSKDWSKRPSPVEVNEAIG